MLTNGEIELSLYLILMEYMYGEKLSNFFLDWPIHRLFISLIDVWISVYICIVYKNIVVKYRTNKYSDVIVITSKYKIQ